MLAERVLDERAYVKEGDWYVSRKYNIAFIDPGKKTLLHGIWIIWAGTFMTAPISDALEVSYDYREKGSRIDDRFDFDGVERSIETAKSLVQYFQVQ